MDFQQITDTFLVGIKQTTPLEYIAVFAGIASVLLSRAENIWLYPVGLINTVIFIYLSFRGQLLGEASVNIYYTAMSIWGWWLWARKKKIGQIEQPIFHITFSRPREWLGQLAFFGAFYLALFAALTYLKQSFTPGAIPWADAFASASAYTGMWLMARKKVESWWWWLVTDICSIPLYFVKGYVFTSFQFLVFTILAVLGLISWWRRASLQHKNTAVL